jgi:hypothetical protein
MAFDGREQGAIGLIRDLTVWLFQEHLQTDSGAGPPCPILHALASGGGAWQGRHPRAG